MRRRRDPTQRLGSDRQKSRVVLARYINSSFVISPVFVYALVWLSALILMELRWATIVTGASEKFTILVVANIAVSILAYVLVTGVPKLLAGRSRTRRRSAAQIPPAVRTSLRRFCDALFIIWILGSIFNAYASGGLPIVWILRGESGRSYADYGVVTLTGLLAACGLFASMGYFLLQRIEGGWRRWWAIALVILYQFLILNRGAVVWIILELAGVYIQITSLRPRRMMRAIAVALIVVIGFGFMGDIRAQREQSAVLLQMGTGGAATVFHYLPSGFWWTYLYVLVGPVNLNASLETVVPLGRPYWSVINLFPSFIRLIVYRVYETSYEARYPLEMVNAAFNVFTMYGGYLADFGVPGCIAVTFLLQLLASHYFAKARTGDVSSILAYGVCLQIIVLSLFTDTFTSWVALFQFALAMAFRLFSTLGRRMVVVRPPETAQGECYMQDPGRSE